MSRPPAARNAVVAPVVTYGPDPHGAALVASLTGAISRTLNGATAVIGRNPTWQGWTRPLQEMRGAAGLGAARVYAPKNSELQRESTTADVTTQAIFASRMMRGQQ